MDANSREKLESRDALETARSSQEHKEKPSASKEVKSKASEVLRSQDLDAQEGQDGAELFEGKVGEVASEDKSHAPAAGSAKSYSSDEIEAIRAKLLAALPPQAIMIKEIKKSLYRKEKVLNKRMKKLKKNSSKQAWHLTIVVAQLRKVREYFSVLAHATYEMVKHLWLKIVHGV